MKIGTDVSIEVCRDEGYAVVEHSGSANAKMNPNREYLLTISNPEAWSEGRRKTTYKGDAYHVMQRYSYQQLYDHFQAQGDGIKRYCDEDNCKITEPIYATFVDFAHLAQILNSYCGLP